MSLTCAALRWGLLLAFEIVSLSAVRALKRRHVHCSHFSLLRGPARRPWTVRCRTTSADPRLGPLAQNLYNESISMFTASISTAINGWPDPMLSASVINHFGQ